MLIVTVAASIEYYRQVRKAQKEYEKAKGIVEDIVLSFNRELKREADKLDVIAFKIEGNLAKADTSLKKVETLEKRMLPLRKSNQQLFHRFSSQKQHKHPVRINRFGSKNQRH